MINSPKRCEIHSWKRCSLCKVFVAGLDFYCMNENLHNEYPIIESELHTFFHIWKYNIHRNEKLLLIAFILKLYLFLKKLEIKLKINGNYFNEALENIEKYLIKIKQCHD